MYARLHLLVLVLHLVFLVVHVVILVVNLLVLVLVLLQREVLPAREVGPPIPFLELHRSAGWDEVLFSFG
jgi:hypothetical protein